MMNRITLRFRGLYVVWQAFLGRPLAQVQDIVILRRLKPLVL